MVNRPHPNPTGASIPVYKAAPCPDCGAGHAAADAAANRRWAASGISPEERQRCTFDTFRLDRNPRMQGVWHAAKAWSRGTAVPLLTLYSPVRGVGKTHLALAAAAPRIDAGEHVLYLVTARYLDRLRAAYEAEGRSPSAAALLRLRGHAESADALILDDLGAAAGTPWADEQLQTIVDWRWTRRLPTLVTTNLPPHDLEPRLASRLCDTSCALVLACTGTDQRLGGGR